MLFCLAKEGTANHKPLNSIIVPYSPIDIENVIYY